MRKRGINFVVYVITLCILYAVLEYLNSRDNTPKDPSQNDMHYIVKAPGALKYAATAMFLLGLMMFIVFFVLKVKNNPSVTGGHLWFAAIFASIGFLIVAAASSWRVVVDKETFTVHKLFQKKKVYDISEIERAEIGGKNQIAVYVSGKTVVTIDGLADNYDRFKRTLRENGKI